MTEEKLYALTDEHVEVLKAWTEYGLSISTDHKELGETADAFHALTPMGTDDAIERMSRAILRSTYGEDSDLLDRLARSIARSDARDALADRRAGTKSNTPHVVIGIIDLGDTE